MGQSPSYTCCRDLKEEVKEQTPDVDVAQLAADEKPPILPELKGVAIVTPENAVAKLEKLIPDRPEELQTFGNERSNIGDHIVPLTGLESAKKFMDKGLLDKLLLASKEDLGRNFAIGDNSLADTSNGNGGIALAVSDPFVEDCPLIYVSNVFEDLTGYPADSVVGRSCRFLQPTSKIMNDASNLKERAMMRIFCTEEQPIGDIIVNLLLNERNTGERFWNLLRMQYVSVEGQTFIFGVQTTLDAFMPTVLKQRVVNDGQANEDICSSLAEYFRALDNLRSEMRSKVYMPIQELKAYYSIKLDMLSTLPMFQQIPVTEDNEDKVKEDRREKEKAPEVTVGCTVMAINQIKYTTYKVPLGTEGEVAAMDGSGNAAIDWKSVGKRNLLRRDFHKIKVKETEAQNLLRLAGEDSHPGWGSLDDYLQKNGDVSPDPEQQAREEAGRKLIGNHKKVIADVTNPSKRLNVNVKPLTQIELKRVHIDSKPHVDDMLREVARRLIGAGRQFVVKADPDNFAQAIAWRSTATYLTARVQSTPEQKPGREADMSEEAAKAFCATLDEVATEAEVNPAWKELAEFLEKPKGSDTAKGIANDHGVKAREEAVRKLIGNRKKLLLDVTNPSTTLNIIGKPLTQTDLKRVDIESRPYVDQMLREVARRLLGNRKGLQALEESAEPGNAVLMSAWKATANYLKERTQSRPDQNPGRKPDMSEPATAAFLAVLDEVANSPAVGRKDS